MNYVTLISVEEDGIRYDLVVPALDAKVFEQGQSVTVSPTVSQTAKVVARKADA